MKTSPDGGPTWSTRTLARAQRALAGIASPKPSDAERPGPSAARPVLAFAARLLGSGATTVLDVGARQVGDAAEVLAQRRRPDGAGDAWWRLHPLASLVGFEPDEDECRRLNDRVQPGRSERHVAAALGKTSGKATLHVAVRPACSSLYPPDEGVTRRYPQVYRDIREVGTQEVTLTTLDAWWSAEGRPSISFAKLDTQGAELDILMAGQAALAGCLGLEVEVEFNAMYVDQPLFHEVDRFLRSLGFSLWRLLSLCHYAEKPRGRRAEPDTVHFDGTWYPAPAGSGRLFWGNAVYFRDYAALSDERDLLILAALLEGVGDLDGAAACLKKISSADTAELVARLEHRP